MAGNVKKGTRAEYDRFTSGAGAVKPAGTASKYVTASKGGAVKKKGK